MNIWHRTAFYLLVGTPTERVLSIPRVVRGTLVRWTRRAIYPPLYWLLRHRPARK